MINLLIILAIIIGLFILYAELLYYFAGQNKQLIFGIIFGIGLLTPIIMNIKRIFLSNSPSIVILGAVGIFFLIFWGATLYEQAGNKERRWYYLTFIIPILALVYQIVNKK